MSVFEIHPPEALPIWARLQMLQRELPFASVTGFKSGGDMICLMTAGRSVFLARAPREVPPGHVVAFTPIVRSDRDLAVSTTRITLGRYETVVFDESSDSANSGKRVGRWVIDAHSEWTTDHEAAMAAHRDAIVAARTEPITDVPPAN